ncbi:hypothetical protein OS493_005209 [Desmophyllum pertusum]|uniref:Uncharacterized protein n=1 Tax=Desmophyllum pertusum TaxID=174260 RepID=A0A9W9Z4J5_9CNID|nr:hypothetical protein OS493_005209 [Desmophyllum pertusum]
MNALLEDNLLFDVQALEKKLSSKILFGTWIALTGEKYFQVEAMCQESLRHNAAQFLCLGLFGDKFEFVFVPLLENLKESVSTSDSGEAADFLEMFVLALFESHQGHLAGKLGRTLLDGILKLSGRNISPYGVRAMTYLHAKQSRPQVICSGTQ